MYIGIAVKRQFPRKYKRSVPVLYGARKLSCCLFIIEIDMLAAQCKQVYQLIINSCLKYTNIRIAKALNLPHFN